MDSLSSILPTVLRKRGLHGHAQAAFVAHRATEWLRAALPAFADRVAVDRLRDGILTVSCGNSIAAQELSPLLPQLREYLERECKGARIEEVRLMRGRGR